MTSHVCPKKGHRCTGELEWHHLEGMVKAGKTNGVEGPADCWITRGGGEKQDHFTRGIRNSDASGKKELYCFNNSQQSFSISHNSSEGTAEEPQCWIIMMMSQ